MGLTSKPYGKWEKNGKITHMTDPETGELKPVNSDQQNPTKGGAKPKGTSAKDAGTAPVTPPNATDIEQRQSGGQAAAMGDADPNKKANADIAAAATAPQTQPPPKTPHNPHRPKDFHPDPRWGRPVDDPSELRDMFNDDPYQMHRTIIPGEQVMVAKSNGALIDTLRDAHTEEEYIQRLDRATISAQRQAEEFRGNLPEVVATGLIKVQNWWQESPQFQEPAHRREQANALLESISKVYKPKFESVDPIERGMRIPHADIEDFLSDFAVGKEISMPPSGFSADPSIARTFAEPTDRSPSVLLRIHPTKEGVIHGLHLTGVPPKFVPESVRRQYVQTQNEFAQEREVMRLPGAKSRCLNIAKVMSKADPNADYAHRHGMLCLYIIDLEDIGYDDALTESHTETSAPHSTFTKYMNTSIRQPTQSPHALTEGKAADDAHALKLTSAGGAYWMDAEYNIVAKTVNDTLVKIGPKDNTAPTNKDAPVEPMAPHQPTGPANFPQSHTKKKFDSPLQADGNVILGKALYSNKEMGGTNPGGIYEGTDEVRRYVKFYNDGNMAECEALADDLYSKLGIPAAKGKYFDNNGKSAFASEMIPNVKGELADFALPNGTLPTKYASQILKGFVADCLMANWDVLGVNEGYMRNMVVDANDKVVRIDNGSSFLHRGLNGRKKDLIGDKLFQLDELEFFVKNNPSYKKVFQSVGMTDYRELGFEFLAQVKDIMKVRQEAGGWMAYVHNMCPDMNAVDAADIIKMLNSRTKILLVAAEKLKNSMDTENY